VGTATALDPQWGEIPLLRRHQNGLISKGWARSVANHLQLDTFGPHHFLQHLMAFWNPYCLNQGAMRDDANFSSPMNLYEACDQDELRILLITGGWDVRRSFNQIGIQPGDRVRVLRHAPFGGPLVIDNQGTQVAVGKQLAQQIRVEVLP
jgi:ferrous iron transport protein A